MSHSHFFKPCVIENHDNQAALEDSVPYYTFPANVTDKVGFLQKQRNRILRALEWVEGAEEFNLADLTEDSLKKIAAQTNGATLHCSGNCAALSIALLYNLKRAKAEIAVTNTWPFYSSIDQIQASLLFFGNVLTCYACTNSDIKELADNVIELYRDSSEKVFCISINYTSFGFSARHTFNAIILGDDANPRVVFVDAWKTFDQVYSVTDLQKRYPGKYDYTLMINIGSVKSLRQQEDKTKAFKL